MQAQDIMSSPVVSVPAEAPVREVAQLLLAHGISAVPVVDAEGRVVGIVSEGDLIRRPELGTERKSNWWLELLGKDQGNAEGYLRSHGGTAGDVMSRRLVTVNEDTGVARIAELLEKHRIKRVPVVRDGRPVGIVSRANLLRALATLEPHLPEAPADDRELRERVLNSIEQTRQPTFLLNVIVQDGKVQVWGAVESEAAQRAVRVAVERVVPAERVEFRVTVLDEPLRTYMWGT